METSSSTIGDTSSHPPCVLIVDDDAAIRLVCSSWLKVEGFEVLEAANGHQALELAFQGAADVVLLDISMPLLDGFGVAAALRSDDRTRELPFVFLSGERDPHVTERAHAAGAAGFFGKPFDPAAVTSALRALIDGERGVSRTEPRERKALASGYPKRSSSASVGA